MCAIARKSSPLTAGQTMAVEEHGRLARADLLDVKSGHVRRAPHIHCSMTILQLIVKPVSVSAEKLWEPLAYFTLQYNHTAND